MPGGRFYFPVNISCQVRIASPSLENHGVALEGLFYGNPWQGSIDSINRRGGPLLKGLVLSGPVSSFGLNKGGSPPSSAVGGISSTVSGQGLSWGLGVGMLGFP